jgi:PAS domain S-box-containing protein
MAVSGERVELTSVPGGAGRPDALVHAAFDLAADGIAVLDTRQSAVRITFANTSFAQSMRADRSGLSGQPLRNLLDAAGVDRAELAARTAAQSGEPQRTEVCIYASDGFPWWAQATFRRLDDAATDGLCLVTFADISTRKYLDDAAASLPITMLILDRQLAIRWVNPATARDFGRDARDLVGLSLEDVLPQARERRPYYERVLAGESLDLEPFLFTSPTGVARVLANSMRPMRGRDGSVQGIFIAGLDESEQVRSRERLDAALRASSIGIWEFDVAGGKVQLDDRCREIFGFTLEQWLADRELWSKRIHPDDSARVLRSADSLARGLAGHYDEEYRFQRADGEWIWIHGHSSAFERDAGGKPRRLVGTVADVTAQHAATEALRKSEATLRALTENAPDRLLLIDRTGRIQFVNQALRGIEPAALLGRDAFELLPEGVRASMRQLCDGALARLERAQAESTIVGTDGVQRHLEFHASPVLDLGRATGLSIRITDITQRRATEQTLRTQARVLETMREAVLLVSPAGLLQLANPAAEVMFGFGSGELTGQSLAALGLPAQLLGQTGADPAKPAGPAPREWLARRRDGTEFVTEALFTPVQFQGEGMVIGVLQDVTESRLMERSIIDATSFEQQRIGSDLHDGLGQEMTGIALMLRSCAISIGREYPAGKPMLEEIIGLVDNAVESARSLARGFSPALLERGGLPAVLADLAARVRHVYGIRMQFRQALHAPLRFDAAAVNHLFRIAQEGVTNAVRHGRATFITLRLSSDAASVRLEVIDNGKGFAPGRETAAGIGMRIMEYRTRLLAGSLQIETPRRGGTALCCCVPQPGLAPPA